MLFSKVSCCLLTHLAILTFLETCEGQNWAAFQNKHVDYPESSAPNTNAYCNVMMRRRRLSQARCKPRNTFIHRHPVEIQEVCKNEGIHYRGNLFDSEEYISVTDCKKVGGRAPSNCKYVGTSQSKRIRVACRNGQPVHLECLISRW